MILFEHVDSRGRGEISDWRLETAQRAKLDERLDRLRLVDRDLAEDLVQGAGIRHLYKLRVRGSVQLRPLLCYGPTRPHDEVTFLARAIEKDGRLRPSVALARATERREVLLAGIGRRKELDV